MPGTNSTTKNSKVVLSAADICAIIKECGQSGVREFSYDSLCISYGQNYAPNLEPVHVAPQLQEAQIVQSQEAIELKAAESQEDRMQQMLITDPAEYERMLHAEEVVDESLGENAESED